MGRRRYLSDINSSNAVVRGMAERNAINTPVQGSAADIIKMAMIRIHEEFRIHGLKSKMVLQVHDELNFDVLNSELEQVERIVRENMEHAVELAVPMTIGIKSAQNWLDAH
jgi:DNA polymerase-1